MATIIEWLQLKHHIPSDDGAVCDSLVMILAGVMDRCSSCEFTGVLDTVSMLAGVLDPCSSCEVTGDVESVLRLAGAGVMDLSSFIPEATNS